MPVKFNIRFFIPFLILSFLSFACIPDVVNENKESKEKENSFEAEFPSNNLSSLQGEVLLPQGTSQSFANIKGQISNFLGFTAELYRDEILIRRKNLNTSGQFFFENLVPSSKLKVRISKNRIVLLKNIYQGLEKGNKHFVSISLRSTAESLIFSNLENRIEDIAPDNIFDMELDDLAIALNTVLNNSNQTFPNSADTILSLEEIRIEINASSDKVYERLSNG